MRYSERIIKVLVLLVVALCAAPVSQTQMASDQSILAQARQLAASEPIAHKTVPVFSPTNNSPPGTYWTLQLDSAPLPYCPFPELPIYEIDAANSVYLIDDRSVDYPAFYESIQMDKALHTMEVQYGLAQATTADILDGGDSPSPMDEMSYSSNTLYIEIAGVSNNLADVDIHGTVADTEYEILSKESLSDTNWLSEGLVLAQGDPTLTAVEVGDRTNSLFFWAKSWADSDGNGLPDWWELQNFGYIGVDAYADPDGDGWNNLQEFQNGTNPIRFDTPPAPQGLTVVYNSSNGLVNVNWQPSPGPITGYTVVKGGQESGQFNISSGVETLNDTVSAVPFLPGIWGPGIDVSYQVQAHYGTKGDSAWSDPVPIEQPPGPTPSISIIPGPQGTAYLAASALPENTVKLRVKRIDWSAQIFYSDSTFDSQWDIPVAMLTNGLYPMPDEMASAPTDGYGYPNYRWWVQAVNANGTPSSAVRVDTSYSFATDFVGVTPFLDGRAQLKQNLAFQLRAANRDLPFSFALDFGDAGSKHFDGSPEYAYAGLYDLSTGNLDDPFLYQNELVPFRDNYLCRNFVFTTQDADETGQLTNGVYYGADVSLPYPPHYLFRGPTTNGAAIATQLSANGAEWTYYLPLSANPANWDLSSIGVSYASGVYSMDGNARNGYGLPYVSAQLAYSQDGLQVVTLDPAHNVPDPDGALSAGFIYPQVEQPQFQTVDYYFTQVPPDFSYPYDTALTPLPGEPEFSVTNTSPLLIAGFGRSGFRMAGYAKLAVTNGYSGVFAYLGQYFDKAYTLGGNGVVTTKEAGVVSPYGDFFPTMPGPAALVTMQDPDTGQQGTGVVNVVKLQLDVNHDGFMDLSFAGPDNTSAARPMVMWANNDYDRPHTVDFTDHEEDDLPTADCPYTPNIATPDYAYRDVNGNQTIPCMRDLEDYARLWTAGLSNVMAVMPANYTVQLTLNGDAQLRIFRAYEANGGTNYLFNETTATNQVANSASLYVGLLSSGSPLILTNRSEHYIWCGAHTGSAEVHLQILDGSQNMLADTAAYIEIKDIKEMYERWTVGDSGLKAPETDAQPAVEDLPAGSSAFQYPYNAATDSETPYILLVHGWNMQRWDKDRFAETAYKRLYWQGYTGRFGLFRWPTLADIPGGDFFGEGWDINNFDKSEYNSWLSGAALQKLLVSLDSKYPGQVRLAAHSMGNIAAGEALRTNTPLVAVYIAMQAAVPAGAYWLGAPFRAIPTIYFDGTTELYRYYPVFTPTNPYFKFAAGAADYVNFYNQSDWALNWWISDQNLKPADSLGYSFDISTGTFYQFQGQPTQRILTCPTNTYELFAFSVEGQCWALGAQTNVAGVFTTAKQLDLDAAFSFGNAHKGHSAEFRSTNMKRAPFWETFATRMGVK